MSPRRAVVLRRVAVDADRPWIVIAVHLVRETQHDGLAPLCEVVRPCVYLRIEITRSDMRQRIFWLVYTRARLPSSKVMIGCAPELAMTLSSGIGVRSSSAANRMT